MMFAACSDDLKVDQAVPEIAQNPTEATAEQVPVQFGAAYVNRATTRAGLTGTLTKGTYADHDGSGNETWDGIAKSGFGVFAYYTNSDLYVADSYKPNFMYNQHIYNVSTTDGTFQWTYEPVRYWPNEFGVSAVSDDVDRVSFFAYAPYVSVSPSTGNLTNGATYDGDNGDATYGIVGLSRNTATSDPYVKYIASLDPSKTVDLTYGVAGATTSRYGLSDLTANVSPMLDLSKPSTTDKLIFDFKHALAALNVQIDAQVDGITNAKPLGNDGQDFIDGVDTTDPSATKTRIYVRSISFEGLTDKGMLNLRDGNWYDMTTGQAGVDGTLDIFDGRNDGREAIMEAVNESNTGLNSDIVQVGVNDRIGVTATPVNLFQPVTAIPTLGPTPTAEETAAYNTAVAAALAEPIYVIPTGQELKVTIVYDVETEDISLPGYLSGSNTHGISVENAITQTVSSGFKLQKATFYTLKLHLGMNSVKFDVHVVDTWPVAPGTEAETSLPANIAGSLNDLLFDYTDYEYLKVIFYDILLL